MEGSVQTVNKESNIIKYNFCKKTLETLIENNIKTIFLSGSGSNGKSYLINELRNVIEDNGYAYHHEPIWYCDETSEDFENALSSHTNKSIMCTFFNPYIKFNIEKPDNVVVINMNHIRFRSTRNN